MRGNARNVGASVLIVGLGGGSPNGAQLFETRVLCLAGTLLTTVELDTASHNPKKMNHGGKTFCECVRFTTHRQNIPAPLTRQLWGT